MSCLVLLAYFTIHILDTSCSTVADIFNSKLANSVDQYQTALKEQSDLGLHYLLKGSVQSGLMYA